METYIFLTRSIFVYEKFINDWFKLELEYKITFWIYVLMLWIHIGDFAGKKLFWDINIKNLVNKIIYYAILALTSNAIKAIATSNQEKNKILDFIRSNKGKSNINEKIYILESYKITFVNEQHKGDFVTGFKH